MIVAVLLGVAIHTIISCVVPNAPLQRASEGELFTQWLISMVRLDSRAEALMVCQLAGEASHVCFTYH